MERIFESKTELLRDVWFYVKSIGEKKQKRTNKKKKKKNNNNVEHIGERLLRFIFIMSSKRL